MKIRNGFVSNSSSSSFLVAFVPEESNLNLKTFDFLLGTKVGNHTYQTDLEVFKETVKERKEKLIIEIENCEKDMMWLKEHVKTLKKISKNEKASQLMDELFYSANDSKHDKNALRWKREQSENQKSWKERVISEISSYNYDMQKLQNDIDCANKQLGLIKDLFDESVVAGWKEDQHHHSYLSELMDELVKDNRVTIIEKYTS